MRKYLHITIAALCLAALPLANAEAQDLDGDNDIRVDSDGDFDIRPYTGFAAGAFGLELRDSAGYSQKSTVFGGYAKLGADIGDNLGAELRIGSSSSGTKGNTKLSDSYFISYLAKLQMPLAPDFKVYALLGGTTANFKKTTAGTAKSQSKTGFSYGLGGDFHLDDRLAAGAEWVQYWTNVKLATALGPNNKAKLWGIMGSLSYHF